MQDITPERFAETLTEQIQLAQQVMTEKGFTPRHVYLSPEFYSHLEREMGKEPVEVCGMTVHISARHKTGYVGLTVDLLYEEASLT